MKLENVDDELQSEEEPRKDTSKGKEVVRRNQGQLHTSEDEAEVTMSYLN